MKTDKILIVGGGVEGWMTAATLISKFPNKEITVVENPEVKYFEFNNSTMPEIIKWLSYIELHETNFVSEVDATIRLSNKFIDFYKKGESFHNPLGEPVLEGNSNVGKYQHNSALHLDNSKFVLWLKDNFCIPKGVKHLISKLTNIKGDPENGIINVDDLTADLYIDCTNYYATLIGFLSNGWYSYMDLLPNNKVIVTELPYEDRQKELVSYTEYTAVENGWVWNVPLWSKKECGFVYSSDFISKHEADKWFRGYLKNNAVKFKHMQFPVGIHKKLWSKNCVAIGMSAGFLEPLASNSLFTVCNFLINLCRELKDDFITEINRSSFNYNCHLKFRELSEFISAYYALSKREDSQYWKFLTQQKNWDEIVSKYSSYYDWLNKRFYENS